GRQVVNLKGDAKLLVVRPVPEGADHVAAIGENRKLVVFAVSEMPEMAEGQGVMLQRYKDGGPSDATVFKLEEGLSWPMGGQTGRTRTENDLTMRRVARGASGRLPPTGFPKTGKSAQGFIGGPCSALAAEPRMAVLTIYSRLRINCGAQASCRSHTGPPGKNCV